MAMVFCRGCGKEIHETALTCPLCGALQKSNAPSIAPSNAQENPLKEKVLKEGHVFEVKLFAFKLFTKLVPPYVRLVVASKF